MTGPGFRSFRYGRALAAALWLAVIATPLAAQAESPARLPTVLQGVVVAGEDGRPVPLALVSLPELGRRLFASPDGSFLVSNVPAGRHRLRIEQIGRASVDTVIDMPMAAAGADARGYVIPMQPQVIALDGLTVDATPGECRARGLAAEGNAVQTALLMDELRKNADRYRTVLDQHPMRVRMEQTRRAFSADDALLSTLRDTVSLNTQESRGEYRPGSVLRSAAGADGRPAYTVVPPSVYSLAQPAFQESHCFRYGGVNTEAGRRMHRIDFVPTSEVAGADVEGSLFIDAESFVLRLAEFRVVRLPEAAPFHDVRIRTTYREISPFLVIPGEIHSTRRLRGARVRNVPVALSVHVLSLLGHDFLGAAPGAR